MGEELSLRYVNQEEWCEHFRALFALREHVAIDMGCGCCQGDLATCKTCGLQTKDSLLINGEYV